MGRLPKFKEQFLNKQYPFVEKSDTKISENNIFELRTGKTHIIRILLECIKYILYDSNLIFYPHDEKNSVIISEQDPSKTIAVYIELNCKEIEHYFCDTKTVVGINVMELFKVIKSVDKDDILFLYMTKDKPNRLNVSTENSVTKDITLTTIELKEDLDNTVDIPDMTYDTSIVIPSSRFQKICKDFNYFNTTSIQIEVIDNKIIFTSIGGDVERQSILQGDEYITTKTESLEYKGIFPLKYLLEFIKATTLCDKSTFYIENDEPLILKYDIVNLGKICFITSNSI